MNPVIYGVVDPTATDPNLRMMPVSGTDNGDGTCSLDITGGGGGGADSTAANQVLQLTQETTTATQITAINGKLPATLGAKASAASLAVVLATDQQPLVVASPAAMVRIDRTRPANTTPYTALDVIGDTGGSAIITFAAMGAAGDNMLLTSAAVRYDVAALPANMAALRLHLYTAAPTAIVDNAAWDLVSGDRANYVGFIDITTLNDFGSTLYTQVTQINKHVKLAGTALYGLLQTIIGFTPAANSEGFSVELGGVKL